MDDVYGADAKEVFMSPFRMNRREMLVMLGAAAATQARADGGLIETTRVDHVALTVPDIKKSMSFYRTLFGNDVLKDTGSERRYLKLGSTYASISPAARANDKIFINHFAVGVKNFDAAKTKATLEKAGFKVTQTGPDLFVADPDGTRVQFSADESWKELKNTAPEAGSGAAMFHTHYINHLAIRVSNREKSLAFYTKLFGPVSAGADTPRPQVKTGQSFLIIYEPEAGLTPDIDHFSVLVDEFDSKAAVAKLKSMGAKADLSRNGSLPEFYDPDGIRLQVQTPRPA